jgi:sugar phosphate isomerase/epimerase
MKRKSASWFLNATNKNLKSTSSAVSLNNNKERGHMAKISVQLYSVRTDLAEDFEGTINKIAAFGYSGVELAGVPGGMSFNQALKVIKKAGLIVSSAHMPLPTMPNKKFIFESLAELGTKYLVHSKSEPAFKTMDLVKKSCDEFNLAAEEATKCGVKVLIHNHWWEFEDLNGEPVYKIMLKNLSPKVNFEIDTYWVTVGGKDPVAVIKEIGSRAPLLHIKDGSGVKGDFNMKAVGQGVMKFKPIFEASAKTAEWLITELDACETNMLQAVKESYDYISANSVKS